MGVINFNVDAKELKLTPNGQFISVDIDMDAADIGLVLDEIKLSNIIEHFGEDVIKTELGLE